MKQQGQNQQDKNPQPSQADKQQCQSGRQGQQGAERDLGSRDQPSRQSGSDLNQGSQQGQRDRSQDKSR